MSTKGKTIELLIEKQENLVPFLKELTKQERKELLPVLLELRKKYDTRHQIPAKYSNGQPYIKWGDFVYPQIHRDLVVQAGVVCGRTLTEFRNHINWNVAGMVLQDHVIENILPWHKPTWFNSEVNKTRGGWGFNYFKMMDLEKKGYLRPTDDLIANLLSNCLVQYEGVGKQQRGVYYIDKLSDYPETLAEHFWLMFEIPSNIVEYSRGLPDEYYTMNHPWFDTIVRLIDQGKIERKKVLSAALLACTKGFNKNQTSWFFKLFHFLNPTIEEQLDFQNEIITGLNSEHATAIKNGLNACKLLYKEDRFDIQNFLNSAPQLLNSSSKSTINTTLNLLDKMAKVHKDRHAEMCEIFTNSLASEDQKIQIKTAKLIDKYVLDDTTIGDSIADYFPNLYSDAKKIIEKYLPSDFVEENVEEEYLAEELELISEDTKIEQPEDFDQLIYQITQVLNSKEDYHLEQVIFWVNQIKRLVTAETAEKLSPVFIRALRFIWGSFGTNGTSYRTTAYYLNDFADDLAVKFPNSMPKRKAYMEKKNAESSYYQDHSKRLRQVHVSVPAYKNFTELYLKGQELLEQEEVISLLSRPTHFPSWIDISILVDRILQYEKHQISISLIDWQIAIFRLPYQPTTEEIIEQINLIQTEHLRKVLLYFYNKKELDLTQKNHLPFVLPAIVSKRNEADLQLLKDSTNENLTHAIAQYQWEHGSVKYFQKEYNKYPDDFMERIRTKNGLFIKELCPKIIESPISSESESEQKSTSEKTRLFDKIKKMISSEVKPISASNSKPKLNQKIEYFYEKYKTTNVDGLFANYDLRSIGNAAGYAYANPNKSNWISLDSFDARRFLMLTPNQSTYYLSRLIYFKMLTSEISGEDDKRIIIFSLESLNEMWYRKEESEITYLFLAASVVSNNKTARMLVSELWIKGNQYEAFDNQKFGIIIGKLLSKNYGTLKRLTDLIISGMYKISGLHDRNLKILLANIIQYMKDEPMTGTKKLLEIFLEMNIDQKESNVNQVKEKLEIWKNTKSLSPVINKLLKRL